MVYPLADYQHCFFIFLCNNVSGMYRKCIAMYRACISSNWLLFYNSILHQTECHCVSNFRVSCSFRFIFQGSCFILFHYRVKIPSSVSKISQYHYTHENVFLCFHLRALCFHFQGFCFLAFPKCFSCFWIELIKDKKSEGQIKDKSNCASSVCVQTNAPRARWGSAPIPFDITG